MDTNINGGKLQVPVIDERRKSILGSAHSGRAGRLMAVLEDASDERTGRRMSVQAVSGHERTGRRMSSLAVGSQERTGRRMSIQGVSSHERTGRRMSIQGVSSHERTGRRMSTQGAYSKPKNRPRKRRDGTPDKSSTTSHEQDENSTPTRNVIWNEEIDKLQIKADELQKVWPPQPPAVEKTFVRIPVQRRKNVPETDKSKSRMTSIAKPAPHASPAQPMDDSGITGPRFNDQGEVIPYSLLGTYEDFRKEAGRKGVFSKEMPAPQLDLGQAETPSLKYTKKKKERWHGPLCNAETNALSNWYYRMMERKRQQDHISNLLQKAPEDLAMNQSDNYREIQEQRYMIDRTIPKVDYGKGYRVGSEFWNQQEQFGDDLTGIHMTLTQTQRGYPPPIEHVGISQIVKEEKGCAGIGKKNVHTKYPWHKSEFFNQRKKQLQPFIDELDPWKPDFDRLQVVGSNKPHKNTFDEEKDDSRELEENLGSFGDESEIMPSSEDMMEAGIDERKGESRNVSAAVKMNKPFFGPSLLFGGQVAKWTGNSLSTKNEIAIEAIINFEAFTGDRITSYLELTNNGTTSIYYDWKKVNKENAFGLAKNVIQRFYFNTMSDVILPGDILKFPFVFKSLDAGVFTEQWKFESKPSLCGGAALRVTLRGVSLQRDTFKTQREQLEIELLHKQAKQVVSYLLYELINGIRTPEPCHSPIDAYITEEEIFLRNNPGLKYDHERVMQLKDLYGQLFDPDVRAENVWSLSIEDLQYSILELDDDEEDKKEMLLHQMNSIIGVLTYIPNAPLQLNLNLFGQQILGETIDRIVGHSLLLRHSMGLSDKDQASDAKEAAIPTSQIFISNGQDDINAPKSGESRKSQRGTDGKNKLDGGKDKPKGSAKDGKAGKASPGKSDAKGKQTSASSSRKATSPAKSSTSTPVHGSTLGDRAGGEDAGSRLPSPDASPGVILTDTGLATAEDLYKERFTLQVYDALGNMADRMDHVFSTLKECQRFDAGSRSKL